MKLRRARQTARRLWTEVQILGELSAPYRPRAVLRALVHVSLERIRDFRSHRG